MNNRNPSLGNVESGGGRRLATVSRSVSCLPCGFCDRCFCSSGGNFLRPGTWLPSLLSVSFCELFHCLSNDLCDSLS